MMPHHSQFSLLARPCFSPVTSTSGPKTLLRRCFRLLRSRHLSSSTRHRVSPALDIQPWIKAKEVVRPAAIWLVPNGSQFDQQQVLDQIPWLQNSNEDLPVSLFLVTPRFAHLFQNAHGFHSRLINSIYRGSAIDSLRQSIVAVVDALPILDKATGNPQPEIDGGEGFAVCVLPGVDVSPATDKDEKQPLISLTGRHPFFDGRRYVSVSFKGSVANTTFVNGQQSTIFMQNWWKESDHEWLPEPRQQKLSHFDIPIYANVNRDPLPALMNAKVIKLTEPKVISSSMGNIVRSVKTADGDEFAASHELERVVPRLLKDLQNSFPKTDLRVFALVYPPKLAGENSFSDRIWNKGKDHMSFHVGLHRKKLLSLLVRGARLYRVTSGGAGWGKKAGLLSLEPTTDLQTPTEQSPTLLSFIFGEDEEIRMPGSADLFPPGYFIQFLATCHDPEGMKKMAVSIEGLKSSMKNSECLLPAQWAEPDQVQQFCVGNTVLPGIHDYNPVPNESDDEHGRSASDWKTNPGLKFCPHRFGFLTSSALGISVKYHSPNQRIQAQLKFGVDPLEVSQADMNHKHSSLVEIPNSYFLARSAAGGRLSKEAARHFAGEDWGEDPSDEDAADNSRQDQTS